MLTLSAMNKPGIDGGRAFEERMHHDFLNFYDTVFTKASKDKNTPDHLNLPYLKAFHRCVQWKPDLQEPVAPY